MTLSRRGCECGASFGRAGATPVRGTAIAAVPLLADRALDNAEAVRGCVAVVLRGGVGFVQKVRMRASNGRGPQCSRRAGVPRRAPGRRPPPLMPRAGRRLGTHRKRAR